MSIKVLRNYIRYTKRFHLTATWEGLKQYWNEI